MTKTEQAKLNRLRNACEALVFAYEAGEIIHGGSVEWEDLDGAAALARDALGKPLVREIRRDCRRLAKEIDNG